MDSLTPAEKTRAVLRQLVQRYGADISRDATRCQGLLRDFCPDPACNPWIIALLYAVREGVGSLPQGTTAASALPIAVSVARLSRQIYHKHATDESLAIWAVVSWCLILGVMSEAEAAQLQSGSQPVTAPAIPPVIANKPVQKPKPPKTTANPKPHRKPPAQRNLLPNTADLSADDTDEFCLVEVEDDTSQVNSITQQPGPSAKTEPQSSPTQKTMNAGEALVAAAVMAAIITTVTLFVDRSLGGGWRSAWSITSSFTMCALGAFGIMASAESEHPSLTAGFVCGGLAGLLYGFATASILPGAFYGACVGLGTSFLARRITGISNPLLLGIVVLGALYGFHAVGMLLPTKLMS
jgi:hypothetical protein